LDSTSIAILNNLAIACDEVGKPDLTLVYLNRIISIDSTFIGAYINLGYKYQKTLEYLNKAASLNPNEAFVYSNRSFSRLKVNDLKGAHEDLDKSIKLYPGNSYAFKVKALILIEEKNYTESCKHLNTASELGYTAQYGLEVEEL
jgi:tetratricopeptide (TPR) repeat protein